MAKIENKSWVEIEVKALDATDEFPNGSFEAVLSTDDLDRDGEVVDYGAFDPLPEYLPCIVDHVAQAKNVVGWGVPSYENGVLMIRGGFDPDEFSQTIRGKLVSRSIRKMSIGFGFSKRTAKDGVPHVTSAEALEASFVVIPANSGAEVVSAKAYGNIEPPDGSFEDVQEDVSEALQVYYGDDAYVCLIATFTDHVVYCVRHWPEQTQDGTYSVTFTLDADGTDGATFTSDPTSVTVTQVISDATAKRWTEAETKFVADIEAKNFALDDTLTLETELIEMELEDDADAAATDEGIADEFDELDELDAAVADTLNALAADSLRESLGDAVDAAE